MTLTKHILIIEDEPKIAQVLVDFLTMDGFSTQVIDDGANAIETIKNSTPTAIILDLMLPNKDGISICQEVRQFSDVPILMLTARIDEIDRLMGLSIGADDYVCKPFSAREVVARIKVILRRTRTTNEQASSIQYKSLDIDTDKYQCRVNQKTVDLTPVEFRIVAAMVRKPGIVFSRDAIMTACYEDDRIVSARTIDSHMKNLRSKLEEADNNTELLHSVYGVGYKLE